MSADQEVVILIADDDAGHVKLMERNLRRAALVNRIERFRDGEEILDFLFDRAVSKRDKDLSYLLLLDIRMPKIDGVDVLRQIKEDPELKQIPVIMLTTTDDPLEIERCHFHGCNSYIVKPIDSERYASAVQKLGEFIQLLKIPRSRRSTIDS